MQIGVNAAFRCALREKWVRAAVGWRHCRICARRVRIDPRRFQASFSLMAP